MPRPPIPALLLVSCGALAACGPSYPKTLREFQAEYPRANVYEQFTGEGRGGDITMYFRFTESDEPEKKEVIWLYERQEDGTWRVINKGRPTPVTIER